jgi:hypothetical protein
VEASLQNCGVIDSKNIQSIIFYPKIFNINSILFLNLAYTDLFPKLSLGTNLFFILSEYAKTQNKKYLYIYESYDNLFNYRILNPCKRLKICL